MPSMLVSGMQAAVGAGGTVDVQPAAGTEYCIYEVGSDAVFVGATPVADVSVAVRDAVAADAIVLQDPTTDPSRRIQQMELYITNGNYMRITNVGAAGSNISWLGERVRAGLTITDLVTLGAGLNADVQPPAGQTWRICMLGASAYNATGHPDLDVVVTDGALVASLLIDSANNLRLNKSVYDWYINNTLYLNVTDAGGAGLSFAYVGRIVPETAISGIQDVGIAGTYDIQPGATEEWVITELGGEQWAPAAPNGAPDFLISVMVGANLSDILEAGSVSINPKWENPFKLHIDNTTYLRATNANAAANELSWMGYQKRTFS